MQLSHGENVSPQQEALSQKWPKQSFSGARKHKNVLKDTLEDNRDPEGSSFGWKGQNAGYCADLEPGSGKDATTDSVPIPSDLPADWDCVFVKDPFNLAPYIVSPMTSSFLIQPSSSDGLCGCSVHLAAIITNANGLTATFVVFYS